MPLIQLVLSASTLSPEGAEALEHWYGQAAAMADTLDVAGGLVVDGGRGLLCLEGRTAAVQALLVSVDAAAPGVAGQLTRWQRRHEQPLPPVPRRRGWRRASVPPTVYDAVDAAFSGGAGAAEGGLILLHVLLGDDLPD